LHPSRGGERRTDDWRLTCSSRGERGAHARAACVPPAALPAVHPAPRVPVRALRQLRVAAAGRAQPRAPGRRGLSVGHVMHRHTQAHTQAHTHTHTGGNRDRDPLTRSSRRCDADSLHDARERLTPPTRVARDRPRRPSIVPPRTVGAFVRAAAAPNFELEASPRRPGRPHRAAPNERASARRAELMERLRGHQAGRKHARGRPGEDQQVLAGLLLTNRVRHRAALRRSERGRSPRAPRAASDWCPWLVGAP